MTRVSRRHFLASTSAAAVALAVRPTPALAVFWLPVVFAVGSYVAGQISAHNRRNVELYYLQSIYKQLGVLGDQVSSLQRSVAAVLDEFADLGENIHLMLNLRSVADLHRKINSVVVRYERETRAVADYTTREKWLSAPYRKDNLNRMLNDLWDARTQLEVSDFPTGPASGLVVSCSALTEMGLMNALKYDRHQVMGRLSEYERWFAAFLDGSKVSSAAGYLSEAKSTRSGIEAEIAKNPIGSQLAKAPEANAACAFLRDYRGPYRYIARYINLGGVGPDKACCRTAPVWEDAPARSGNLTRIWLPVAYRDSPAEQDQRVRTELEKVSVAPNREIREGESGLVLRSVVRLAEKPEFESKPANAEPWKGAPECSPVTRDLPEANPEKLSNVLQTFPTWTKGMDDLAALTALLDKYNFHTSRVVFAERSIAAVKDTLSTLGAIKRSYQG